MISSMWLPYRRQAGYHLLHEPPSRFTRRELRRVLLAHALQVGEADAVVEVVRAHGEDVAALTPAVLLVMLASISGSKKTARAWRAARRASHRAGHRNRAPSLAAARTAASNASGRSGSRNFRAVWPFCGPLFSQKSFA